MRPRLTRRLGVGACSPDQRAILAPSDAQISLASIAPLVAVNDATIVEIQVVKSDGSPVRDGTEVVVVASSGEIVQSWVRTSGGVASVEYRAVTEPGIVEFEAISDAARGALTLPAPRPLWPASRSKLSPP